MPSVNIWEKDLTSSGQTSYDNFVVLVPGLYDKTLWGKDFTKEYSTDPTDGYDVLVSNNSGNNKALTFADFDTLILGNGDPEAAADKAVVDRKREALKTNYGYKLIKKLVVDFGMTVEYGVYSNPQTEITEDYFKKFQDKGLYDLRFITTGGYTDVDINNISLWAIRCAAERGDAIAIIDIPASYTVEGENEETITVEIKTAQDIQTYINSLDAGTVTRTSIDGKTVTEDMYAYAAAFAPEITYGDKTKTTEKASFAYLADFGKHINRFPEWYAMAGSVRGVIPCSNVEPVLKFSDNDINKYLTTRDGLKRACNPICEVRPYGNIIYGNRTMFSTSQEEAVDYGTGLRASHFLNIRQLCCTLKKTIYRAARRFMFEPNTDVLWANFCEAIRPTLELMKTSQGIKGYTIRREATKVKGLLKAVITITPIEAVEDFDIGVELSDSVEIYE